jgi:hypothetical protein
MVMMFWPVLAMGQLTSNQLLDEVGNDVLQGDDGLMGFGQW